MSEEILKALMQLFAIIAKQDGGVEDSEIDFVESFLTTQLSADFVEEYLGLFYKHADIISREDNKEKTEGGQIKLTSVKDSVRILGICKKINKTLTQEQKVVVLVRIFELVAADKKFSEQRMAILNTVAEVFNIAGDEFKGTETFVVNDEVSQLDNPSVLVIDDKEQVFENAKFILSSELDGEVFILHIKSVELYFLRYTGKQEVLLNGLPVRSNRIYLFANGSSIRFPKGKPVYYSDVVSKYMTDVTSSHITYNVNNVEFKFKNGGIGLRDINLSEEQGRLIGIMGASGAGKTTLLNVLTGIESPSDGEVLINGINLHTENKKMEGVIGYIPQDDLLIEELTVYENLYFNAKLCFKDLAEEELHKRVEATLSSLGLLDRKDLTVGSPLNKTISGGQRKRLNIALELIREPPILFVDEPTSGLSSRDSENVMDLLRELSMKGKLIYVVIHQPSSEIYKMFDKMIILDTGGYEIYYGNPVEAVTYFKKLDAQINSEVGECQTCGNVNPELIFNIIDAQVVDEFGRYTNKRKVTPEEWEKKHKELQVFEKHPDVDDAPPKSLNIPSWFKQTLIYFRRDSLAKISNRQYIILNILEAPLLGFILSFLIRYIADPNSKIYIFRENENIPVYIFMSMIVAMFLGLMVSGEEIFKDRKILKREAFLNLSRSSYLISKIVILFILSAIQAFLFVLVGNFILGIQGLWFEYWWALFSIATFSNLLGLNLSSAFNSAVTIYIMIPLVMIPQMALGGAMFSFDKLNRAVGSIEGVPPVCEVMATRWVYEGLMVRQFKDNEFEKDFYEIEKAMYTADFKNVYYLPELEERIDYCISAINTDSDSIKEIVAEKLALLKNELHKESVRVPKVNFDYNEDLTIDRFTSEIGYFTAEYINKLNAYYASVYGFNNDKKQKIINYLDEKYPGIYNQRRQTYHNEATSDIVRKIYEKNKIIAYKDRLIQQTEPIYETPWIDNPFDFRAQFFSPTKHFGGKDMDTFWFNMWVVWVMSIGGYIALYYDWLKKFMDLFQK
ncbi:MAG: ATP-binding cassette domain-containing protein [Salinivirgaceae bacterium]|jgi:ABC-type multidrug transport system ATPase subunit|nr:ATP-binding cassette domain-containing protein [Salinivirgaceae bacterium]